MAEKARERDKLKVFISYSRDDLAFADQLVAGLELTGFEPIIDRHGISGGEDWQNRLGALIRDADTVVFVLSPRSAVSKICEWEVEEAARLNKRILPVVCAPLDGAAPPARLRGLNYIFFYPEPETPGSGFAVGLKQLTVALNTDLDWMREHTRLLQRALEWETAKRIENRMLSGPDIAEAKAWAARRPKDAPEPTPLHLDYIRASEAAEDARLSSERRRLADMASAQEERAKALAEAELALKREAEAQRGRARARGIIMWGSAAAAVVLAGVAAVAGMQWRKAETALAEAKTEKARAERFMSMAVESARDILEDFKIGAADVQGVPRAATRKILNHAHNIMNRFVSDQDKGSDSSVAMGLEQAGDIKWVGGDHAGARADFAKALAMREKLAAARPGDIERQRDLSSVLMKFGDANRIDGNRDDALATYQAAVAVQEKLMAAEPANKEWPRILAASFAKIADIRRDEGKKTEAVAFYEKALALREALVASDPSNMPWQRDLSVNINRIGDMRRDAGDKAGALSLYTKALAIKERLVASDSGNALWQRDLSVNINKIADLRRDDGDKAVALDLYEKALAITDALVASDPGNGVWQGDLLVSLVRIAKLRLDTDDKAAALMAHRRALAAYERFAASTETEEAKNGGRPGKATAQALVPVAWYALFAGDFAKALSVSERALTLDPERSVVIDTNRAHALIFLGRVDEARKVYADNRGKKVPDGRTWEAVIVEDFGKLRKGGLDNPLMAEVEALFKAPAPAPRETGASP